MKLRILLLLLMLAVSAGLGLAIAQTGNQGAQGTDDSSPLNYVGWNEYAEGSRKVFATLTSVKMTPEDDIQTHRRGDVAWGTATFQFEIVPKEGRSLNGKATYTVVWERPGDKWLIVHEHASVPMDMPPAGANP